MTTCRSTGGAARELHATSDEIGERVGPRAVPAAIEDHGPILLTHGTRQAPETRAGPADVR